MPPDMAHDKVLLLTITASAARMVARWWRYGGGDGDRGTGLGSILRVFFLI